VADDLDRFLALVRRELGCDEVQVVQLDPDADPGALRDEFIRRLPDGRAIKALFRVPPDNQEARLRRLDMLVSTFFDAIAEDAPPARRSRPPVASSLRDELTALVARAAAVNAAVIDANSPVIWGAAHAEGLSAPLPDDSDQLGVAAPQASTSEEEARVLAASRRALREVRGWEDLAALRRGKRLRRVDREGEAPLLAHSFAGIYVLVLVYLAPFDELRSERATLEALPRIERLVLALPPLDPQPSAGAGVVALRRPRRR
jgi:hypothetical protein